mmetsp:Transcript_72841/g.126441  ORF Transcript_72841/g.126441 Transcript_72841/m.126441 type:complete len:210 (-) Transcript_72841:35-664(-)
MDMTAMMDALGGSRTGSRGMTPRGTPRVGTPLKRPSSQGSKGGPPSARGSVMRGTAEQALGLTTPRADRPPSDRLSATGRPPMDPPGATGRPRPEVADLQETEEYFHLDLEPGDWRHNDAIMKKRLAKDRVAFLMYRAPPTSWPSARLSELESVTPIGIKRWETTTSSSHMFKSHAEDNEKVDKRHARRRDRVTEYTEARLLQANVLRK